MTDAQEQHRTIPAPAKPADPLPGPRTAPISADAGTMAARHGDPTGWDADTCSLYIELGGAQ